MEIETIQKIYRSIDRLDAGALVDIFSDDATMLVGSQPPLSGRDEIFQGIESFFADLHGIHHEIHDIWQVEGKQRNLWVAHADAWFRVRGCREPVFVRGAMVLRFKDGQITSGRFLYDLSPVWEAIGSPGRIFEAIDGSFPASDPPAWTP